MDHVAKVSGVSKAMVSRALAYNPRVTEKTRARVLNVVSGSGYGINNSAQRLRENRTNALAVVTDLVAPDGQQAGAWSMTLKLVSDTARALALRTKTVLPLPAESAREVTCQTLLAEKSVDGFIFSATRARDLLHDLNVPEVPFVAWDDHQERESYCVVTGADHRAGRMAGRHLADLGCTATLFVHTVADSLAAARLASLAAGLEDGGGGGEIQSLEVEDSSPFGVCTAALEWRGTAGEVDSIVVSGECRALGRAWAADHYRCPFTTRVAIAGLGMAGLSERMPSRVIAVEKSVIEAGDLLVEKLLGRLEGIDCAPTTLRVYLRRFGTARCRMPALHASCEPGRVGRLLPTCSVDRASSTCGRGRVPGRQLKGRPC